MMRGVKDKLVQVFTAERHSTSERVREGFGGSVRAASDAHRYADGTLWRGSTFEELSRELRGTPLERTTPSTFDPSKPASARNMPPMDQLGFEKLGLGGTGTNYLIWYRDEPIAVYKIFNHPTKGRNEASAWRADQLLGLDIVPYTREWVGPKGPGSLQDFVPNDGPNKDLHSLDAQKTAVFDYIMASEDRHFRNAIQRKGQPGRLGAIDNERILEDRSKNKGNVMRSVYIEAHIGKNLDPSLVDHLKTIDPRSFSESLQAMGYRRDTADWAAERLIEIQRNGKITGEAWGCAIVNGTHQVIYPPGYYDVFDYLVAHPYEKYDAE